MRRHLWAVLTALGAMALLRLGFAQVSPVPSTPNELWLASVLPLLACGLAGGAAFTAVLRGHLEPRDLAIAALVAVCFMVLVAATGARAALLGWLVGVLVVMVGTLVVPGLAAILTNRKAD